MKKGDKEVARDITGNWFKLGIGRFNTTLFKSSGEKAMVSERQSGNGNYKHIFSGLCIILLFFVALTFIAVASAATIYVPEGGNQTIQQAVNNATAGDTIIVRDDWYKDENVNVNVAHLTIKSENGSVNCIVNASNLNKIESKGI